MLAVLAAVGFVLAAPRLLDLSGDQAAIPAPPAGTGEVASVVAPGPPAPPDSPGQTPSPGETTATGPSEASPAGTAGPAGPGSPAAFPGIAPNERPTGGGISATPQPGVGEAPGQDGDDEGHGAPSHPAKEHKGHKQHHGHGKGHEHHGNGKGNGHSGDGDGQQQDNHHGKDDHGKHDNGHHDNGKHNGWTKPDKDPPEKSHDSLGSGHGNGQKPDREHGQGAKHGKSDRRAHSHPRSRR